MKIFEISKMRDTKKILKIETYRISRQIENIVENKENSAKKIVSNSDCSNQVKSLNCVKHYLKSNQIDLTFLISVSSINRHEII